jgi:hypothetical protein
MCQLILHGCLMYQETDGCDVKVIDVVGSAAMMNSHYSISREL